MRWRVGPPHQISSLLPTWILPHSCSPERRVLLFVGANEKSDWNFSLKIKPTEMGEAPEGGWIQSQHQTATQPAAVPKSCFQVSRSWRLWGHLWIWLQQLSCRHKDYLHSSRRRVNTKGAGGGEGHHLRCYSSRVVCMARHKRMSFQTWDTP